MHGFADLAGGIAPRLMALGGGGVAGQIDIVNATPDGCELEAVTFHRMLNRSETSLNDPTIFSRLAILPAGAIVAADAEFKSLEQLMEAIEEAPARTCSYSDTGVGGSWHFDVDGILNVAGLDHKTFRWAPSRGSAPALQDLVAGDITMVTSWPVGAQCVIHDAAARAPAQPEAWGPLV